MIIREHSSMDKRMENYHSFKKKTKQVLRIIIEVNIESMNYLTTESALM